MGLIKEPSGVDFFVEPRLLSEEEKTKISSYIAAYKSSKKRGIKTGKKEAKVKKVA
jgi:hypothetical protein